MEVGFEVGRIIYLIRKVTRDSSRLARCHRHVSEKRGNFHVGQGDQGNAHSVSSLYKVRHAT